jgi:hypothetical protein
MRVQDPDDRLRELLSLAIEDCAGESTVRHIGTAPGLQPTRPDDSN